MKTDELTVKAKEVETLKEQRDAAIKAGQKDRAAAIDKQVDREVESLDELKEAAIRNRANMNKREVKAR